MAVWREFIERNEESDFTFTDNIVGGVIPREFIGSNEKGFKSMMEKGQLIGAPLVNVAVTIAMMVHTTRLTLLMSRSRKRVAVRGETST